MTGKRTGGPELQPEGEGLAPGQLAELVIARRDGSAVTVRLVSDKRIEAPNWSPCGRWLVVNAEGRLYRVPVPGGNGLEPIDSAPFEALNNDHVLSPDGRWIYVSNSDGHLYRMPFSGGVPEQISNSHHRAFSFRYYLHGVSPDGAFLSYVGVEERLSGEMSRIFVMPAVGGEDIVLSDGEHWVDGPEFSADGEWIWFNAELPDKPGSSQIYRMRRDGSQVERITHDDRPAWFPHMAPDGSLVCYVSYPPGTGGHPWDREVIVRVMKPDGSGQLDIDRFNGGQGSLNVPSWAPDSSAFAYVRYPY